MNLEFNLNLAAKYVSPSQVARILTEDWVKKNSFCPHCGNENVSEFTNNRPVADFYCSDCNEEFELKSKTGRIGRRIVDGAYSTMIERIQSDNNPNFFFLTYDRVKYCVNSFVVIPKQFFIPEIIEKRKPLAETARRAGWTGCNIDLAKIPEVGKIFIVKEAAVIDKKLVLESFSKTVFLRNRNLDSKGWIIDVLNCIERIDGKSFTLTDVYKFEQELKFKHASNNFIKDKIRQQLQVLRDMNIIEFTSRGNYRKIQI